MGGAQTTGSGPLDARLARWAVQPLRASPVTPNHITTLRLLLGLGAAAGLAAGSFLWANIGAWLFVASDIVDHADGELARISGKSSRWGHYYDLACDALVHVVLFFGIGIGLRDSALAAWAIPMGLLAGLAVAAVFWLHLDMASRFGESEAALPSAGWFEIEDVLYLLPAVTFLGGEVYLLCAAVAGAPTFGAWLLWYRRRLRGRLGTA